MSFKLLTVLEWSRFIEDIFYWTPIVIQGSTSDLKKHTD